MKLLRKLTSEKKQNKTYFSTTVMAIHVSINFQNFTTVITKYVDRKKITYVNYLSLTV